MLRPDLLRGAVLGSAIIACFAAISCGQEFGTYQPVVGNPAPALGQGVADDSFIQPASLNLPGYGTPACATPGCATQSCASPNCCSAPRCGASPSCCASPGCASGCCQPCCQSCCCGRGGGLFNFGCPLDCEDGCDPFTLFPGDNCRGWFFNGWLNAGAYFNSHGNTRAGGNGPIPFNFNGNRIMMNQAWFNLGKGLNFDDGRTWDWGWNADVVYGTDALATQAFGDRGWDFGWNSSSVYGTAIPQLYAEAGTDVFSTKVGHFYTIQGYEVVQATGNFFYSHAYTMNYGEPFTHTGVLTTWNPSDDVTVWNGYVWGWDSGFENGLEAHSYLGGMSMPLGDISTLTYTALVGNFGDGTFVGGAPGGSQGNIYNHSIVLDTQLTDRFNTVLQSDFGTNYNVPGGGNSQWYGINQYFFYDLTCNLRGGLRAEWFADPNGVRVGNGNGEYTGITAGLNWLPTPNLTFRPEVRYDMFRNYNNNNQRAFNPNAAGVNQDGAQWSFGMDGIWTF